MNIFDYINKSCALRSLQNFFYSINIQMDMIMHQNTVILESLRNFAQIIKDKFFDPFEKQVWSNFFHCSIAFLIQPALQLDQFTRNKTSIILSRYCDIRRETALEICNMWYNLGEHKISKNFIQ